MKRFDWTCGGMDVSYDGEWVEFDRFENLQRQLAEVTKERDQLQAALKLADALRNRQMGGGK
jgi:hypothetical protein